MPFTWAAPQSGQRGAGSHALELPKVDEDAAKVLVVFLQPNHQLANVTLIQEAQHLLLELTAAFAGNDLHQFNLFANRFLHDAISSASISPP